VCVYMQDLLINYIDILKTICVCLYARFTYKLKYEKKHKIIEFWCNGLNLMCK